MRSGLASQLDEPQSHTIATRPAQHRLAGKLLPVVRSNYGWLPPLRTDAVEDMCQVVPAHGVFHDHRYRFMRRIVDDGQAFQRAPRDDPVEHKID